ncbi:MAG: phosphatase PAP2 family protein [Clostridia bacterium]|nr:phosphatase PAP2 family protein [Clostridia bacterium]
MKKKNGRLFLVGTGLLISFVLWTVLILFVDVRAIGPEGSSVGFASLNGFVHNITGVNMSLYVITDWLGLVPIGVAFGFAVLGLVQWIKRKSLLKVDRSILALGGFYIIVMAVYVLFEIVVINYRPTLINGYLEASYPSSTTMLVMCVMPTAMVQLCTRIKNDKFRRCIMLAIAVFIAFMVIGRLVSGVHWITDIIGGALFSAAIVLMYYSICNVVTKNYYTNSNLSNC